MYLPTRRSLLETLRFAISQTTDEEEITEIRFRILQIKYRL